MLSLLGRGIRYILNLTVDPSPINENKTDEEAEEIPIREWGEDEITGEEIPGEITNLSTDYGLINEYIYFDLDIFPNGYRPSIGMKVSVKAKCENGGTWKAKKITVIVKTPEIDEDWDDNCFSDNVNDKYEMCDVGKVTSLDTKCGYINGQLKFEFECVTEGFSPCVGDWVDIKLLRSDSEQREKVIWLAPLQTKKIEGVITKINSDFGIIEEEVYFLMDTINDTSKLRRGDEVMATVIESNFKKYNWRATFIVPKPRERKKENGDHTNKNKNVPLEMLIMNKMGVSVTSPLDFGNVEIGKKNTLRILVRNDGLEEQTLLSFQLMTSANKQFSVRSLYPDVLKKPLALTPGCEVGFVAECQPCILGKSEQMLVFNFDGFTIGRILSAHAGFTKSQSVVRAKLPNTRFDRIRQSILSEDSAWHIPGQKPKFENNRKRIYGPMSHYKVPERLRNCVINNENVLQLEPCLTEPLTEENYKSKFKALLHLEEIAQELELQQHTLTEVILERVAHYLSIEIPGLSENRPNLIIGDTVIVHYSEYAARGESAIRYEGSVHEISDCIVHLLFHPKFHEQYNDEFVDVFFKLNRTTLRRCHQAVQVSDILGQSVLFPRTTTNKPPKVEYVAVSSRSPSDERSLKKKRVTVVDRLFSTSPNAIKTSPQKEIDECSLRDDCLSPQTIQWFNETLNERQKLAVERILRGESRPVPYVIFGPPGTGKTVTVVEAVLQVLHLHENSRVLVCTPSNSAADVLAERFHASGRITRGGMIRVNAMQRNQRGIPESIIPYCILSSDVDVQAHYRLIICTCSTSATFRTNLNLPDQHFTHIFVDEAGQATEPECLIPLLYSGPDGQIILAGDPHQLGAVIKSRLAISCGLPTSLLERLMNRPIYLRDAENFPEDFYNPFLVTKLTYNYRSHPSLLKTPSDLFYEGELIAKVDPSVYEKILSFDFLPKRGFPFIFHGIQGEALLEGRNPSWFNAVEVVQIIRYISMLYGEGIDASDIGVVTPYRKQVEKIRLMLETLNMGKPKVGSTEEFQGQERSVIIISTVRSGDCFDTGNGALGFLRNKKRFNVAVTRAKGLLIVVGDPFVLSGDPCWRALITYSVENESYVGCDLPKENFK